MYTYIYIYWMNYLQMNGYDAYDDYDDYDGYDDYDR